MKKFLVLALTLIMLTALFASCASTGKPSAKAIDPDDFYSDYTPDPDFSWKKAEKVQALSGKTNASSNTILVPFKTVGTRKTDISIYNLLTNTEVHSFTVDNDDIYHIDTFNVYGNAFFTVVHGVVHAEKTEFTTTLYTAAGKQVAKADGAILRSNASNNGSVIYPYQADGFFNFQSNLIRFDDAIYQISEDGSVSTLKEKSPFTPDLPYIAFYNGEYYITLNDGTNPSIVVYDNSLEAVSHWEYEFMIDDNSDYELSILNNGSVLFQLLENLPDDAKDYEFMAEGEKYNLSAWLINPKNGSAKALNNNFYVMLATALDTSYYSDETYREEAGISKKHENVAIIAYIQDQKLSTYSMVSLTNACKVKGELFTDLPMISTNPEDTLVEPLGDGKFVYLTVLDTYIIIDAKGKKIAEIPEDVYDDAVSFGEYYVIDGAVYDSSFNLKYDFEKENYSLFSCKPNSLLLENKDGDLYLYNGSTTTLIYSAESNDYYIHSSSPHCYCIYSFSDQRYNYYNDLGEFLFSSYREASKIMTNNEEDIALFRTTDSEGNVYYYRVSK
ncbi:MAG: hypothetical protein IJA86_01235 [Clostridia bacterium]|nr:hypothetical protein [Clostridia bacterium]